MKHMKVVTRPSRAEEVVDFTTCDLCGDKIGMESVFDADEVEVHHRTGSQYPEGGTGQDVVADICGKCFDNKLVPWLESQGVKFRVEEWSW